MDETEKFLKVVQEILGASFRDASWELKAKATASLAGQLYKLAADYSEMLGLKNPLDVVALNVEKGLSNNTYKTIVNILFDEIVENFDNPIL